MNNSQIDRGIAKLRKLDFERHPNGQFKLDTISIIAQVLEAMKEPKVEERCKECGEYHGLLKCRPKPDEEK